MRLFVTGYAGQVATALREAAAEAAGISLAHGARPEFDLTDPGSVHRAIAAFRPTVVVNAAAYTAVEAAEDEPDLAFAINRDGAAAVARAAAAQGAPVIQLSTDYVFDGVKAGPYVEADWPAPLSVYGESKLAGEAAVAREAPRHLILRTSWVYAPYGSNFVRTMSRLGSGIAPVVTDQLGCPTYAPDIAATILNIARCLEDDPSDPALLGVTHIAGPDAVSWCDFARRIAAGLAERGLPAPTIEPTTTAGRGGRARRPANSRLATERLRTTFGIELPALDASLGRCLDRLAAAALPQGAPT